MSNTKDRLEWLDIMKGIAIALVVIAHLDIGTSVAKTVSSFIYMFHMPLFMFITGYTTALAYYNNGVKKKNLSYQIANCYLVYVVFSYIYAVFKLFVRSGNSDVSYKNLITLYYKPIAHYWYIFAMIILYIYFMIAGKYLISTKYGVILLAIEWVLKYVWAYIPIKSIPFFDIPIAWAPFWHVGILYREIDEKEQPKKILMLIAIIMFFIYCILKIININFIAEFWVCGLIYIIFRVIQKTSERWPKLFIQILQVYGKNSMPIYLTHSYLTYCVAYLANKATVLSKGGWDILTYILAAILVLILSLGAGIILNKYFPMLLKPVKFRNRQGK